MTIDDMISTSGPHWKWEVRWVTVEIEVVAENDEEAIRIATEKLLRTTNVISTGKVLKIERLR